MSHYSFFFQAPMDTFMFYANQVAANDFSMLDWGLVTTEEFIDRNGWTSFEEEPELSYEFVLHAWTDEEIAALVQEIFEEELDNFACRLSGSEFDDDAIDFDK